MVCCIPAGVKSGGTTAATLRVYLVAINSCRVNYFVSSLFPGVRGTTSYTGLLYGSGQNKPFIMLGLLAQDKRTRIQQPQRGYSSILKYTKGR